MSLPTAYVSSSFNDLRQLHDGVEFRSARELQKILGYTKWKDLKSLIFETAKMIELAGDDSDTHIMSIDRKTITKKGEKKTKKKYDFLLTRYACYVLIENADESILEVAVIKSYFAKVLAQEGQEKQENRDAMRKEAREEISEQNKRLFGIANKHGVKDFSGFNNAGYMGLYGMRNSELLKYKGLGKDKLLDRASMIELTANLSRITETENMLISENAQTQTQAEQIHFSVGKHIREEVLEKYGLTPENLPPNVHIEHIEDKP